MAKSPQNTSKRGSYFFRVNRETLVCCISIRWLKRGLTQYPLVGTGVSCRVFFFPHFGWWLSGRLEMCPQNVGRMRRRPKGRPSAPRRLRRRSQNLEWMGSRFVVEKKCLPNAVDAGVPLGGRVCPTSRSAAATIRHGVPLDGTGANRPPSHSLPPPPSLSLSLSLWASKRCLGLGWSPWQRLASSGSPSQGKDAISFSKGAGRFYNAIFAYNPVVA